ncbi:MAG: hypothetical protein N3C12_07350 [Candidatus Binatia bacterium]|nr:hypothetical protein [Candidatus Binatia bacterium]
MGAEGWSAKFGQRLFDRFEQTREVAEPALYVPALRRFAVRVGSFAQQLEPLVVAADEGSQGT